MINVDFNLDGMEETKTCFSIELMTQLIIKEDWFNRETFKEVLQQSKTKFTAIVIRVEITASTS